MLSWIFTKTPLLFFVQDLWRDEAFSSILAERGIVDILRLTASDFNPPLYYVLLHIFTSIFGHSEIALRALSFVFFALTLFICFEIMVHVMKVPMKRALVYFSLFITNPLLLTYAFEARMYMMVTCFVALSYYALFTKKNTLYVIAATLALYTHYFAFFIILAQLIPSLVQKIDKDRGKTLRFSYLYEHFKLFLLPIFCFVPWGLALLALHDFRDKAFWILEPTFQDLKFLLFTLYTGYEPLFGTYYHGGHGYTSFHMYFLLLIIGVVLVPLGASAYTWFKSSRFFHKHISRKTHPVYHLPTYLSHFYLWAFLPPVTIYMLSFVYEPLYLPRYFIFSGVGLLFVIVFTMEYLFWLFGKKWIPATIFVGLLLLVLLKDTNTYNTLNLKYHSKLNIAPLFKEIEQVRIPGDIVYVTSELDYYLALYYLKTNKDVFIFSKDYKQIPQYVGKVLIPSDVLSSAIPTFPKKAYLIYYNRYEVKSML